VTDQQSKKERGKRLSASSLYLFSPPTPEVGTRYLFPIINTSPTPEVGNLPTSGVGGVRIRILLSIFRLLFDFLPNEFFYLV